MPGKRRSVSHIERTALVAILVLFGVMSVVGIQWGLPSRSIDQYLFGDEPVWPGKDIYRLAGAGAKFSPQYGADVDVDPLAKSTGDPILLTATDEDVAKIYLRYRLYTYQPDEMITMMALAGMNPRQLDLDPRLYQYGGLFIYPVGALIAAGDLLGLIDVRSDVVYYLDHPDEFGKFYMVARGFSAAWGMLGVIVVFAIGRRLGGIRSGLIAALLFTLMPVVVCMAHEGKPHLPGAVLMLLAVLLAMRHLRLNVDPGEGQRGQDRRKSPGTSEQVVIPAPAPSRDWWLMCVCCGAAFGVVLSSWPIFVLIPLVALLDWRRTARLPDTTKDVAAEGQGQAAGHLESPDRDRFGAAEYGGQRGLKPAARSRNGGGIGTAAWQTIAGVAVGVGVYLVVNPYILINAFSNRAVLRSNFGNSLAMYEISRIGQGLRDVLASTIEGATLPILVLGVIALIAAMARKNTAITPLAASAAVFFLQFVLIGADKPTEYGRFGVFANTALAIGTACIIGRRWSRSRSVLNAVPVVLVLLWVGIAGAAYLANFRADAASRGSRSRIAEVAQAMRSSDDSHAVALCNLAVFGEPAPYCCPPLDFSTTEIRLYRSFAQFADDARRESAVLLYPFDRRGRFEQTDTARQLGLTAPAGSFETKSIGRRLYETEISWANKPFFVGDRGEASEGAPTPASDWLR